MDTFEKKYNDALERARKIKNGEGDWRYSDLIEITPALIEIFPQLCESEDEKIRKELLSFIESVQHSYLCATNRREKWISYLEKQKDCILVPKSHLDPPGEDGEDGMKILEKQKEQKPINNSTREKIISRATSEKQVVLISESSGNAEIGWDTRSLEDAKKLLEYGLAFIKKNGIVPAEKQDYSGLTDLERTILKGFLSAGVENVPVTIIKETAQECLALNEKHIADVFEKVGLAKIVREQENDELTNAVQSAMIELSKVENAEWSEEDEKIRKWLYDYICNCPNNNFAFYGGVGKDAVLNYLEKQKEKKHATIEQVYKNFLSSDTLKSIKENKYIRARLFWELMHNGIITEVDYQYLTDDKRKPWTEEEYQKAYKEGFETSEQLKHLGM